MINLLPREMAEDVSPSFFVTIQSEAKTKKYDK